MGALTVLVEDHDHFGRGVQRVDRVRGHGRELGRLPLLDDDHPIAEYQTNAAFEHEEPVVTRMDARL